MYFDNAVTGSLWPVLKVFKSTDLPDLWEWKNLWGTKTFFLSYHLIPNLRGKLSVQAHCSWSGTGVKHTPKWNTLQYRGKLFFIQSGSLMVKILSLLTLNKKKRHWILSKGKTDHRECWGFKRHSRKLPECVINKLNTTKDWVFQKFVRAPGDEQLSSSSSAEKHEMNFRLQLTRETSKKEHLPF